MSKVNLFRLKKDHPFAPEGIIVEEAQKDYVLQGDNGATLCILVRFPDGLYDSFPHNMAKEWLEYAGQGEPATVFAAPAVTRHPVIDAEQPAADPAFVDQEGKSRTLGEVKVAPPTIEDVFTGKVAPSVFIRKQVNANRPKDEILGFFELKALEIEEILKYLDAIWAERNNL